LLGRIKESVISILSADLLEFPSCLIPKIKLLKDSTKVLRGPEEMTIVDIWSGPGKLVNIVHHFVVVVKLARSHEVVVRVTCRV